MSKVKNWDRNVLHCCMRLKITSRCSTHLYVKLLQITSVNY